jgi:hypothetical protein
LNKKCLLSVVLCPAQKFFSYGDVTEPPMFGAQGLWVERDHYRTTLAVTEGLSFSSLIRRMAQFNRHLRLARGCRRLTLIWIHTGPKTYVEL